MQKIAARIMRQDDDALLMSLGRTIAANDTGRNLKGDDVRQWLSLGRQWFATISVRTRSSICGSEWLRDALVDDQAEDRVAVIVFVAERVLDNFAIEEEGAVAFAVLLLRRGIQVYCEAIWTSQECEDGSSSNTN